MLLDCLTHRRGGHYEGDPQEYRDPLADEEWRRKDPVIQFQERAQAEGWIHADEATSIEAEAKAAVESAVEFARASPFPEPSISAELVYATATADRGD
jgi:pyruvate dehydrogenase E1 component alpha subunit